MKEKQVRYEFDYPVADVFSKINAALYLDLNENSETLNTSYAHPVGTEFQYREKSFGHEIVYHATITEYEKPKKIIFELVEEKTKTIVQIEFVDKGTSTEVIYTIELDNAKMLKRFMKRNHINAWLERFESEADYASKTLKKH